MSSNSTTSYQVRTEAALEHYESLQAKARESLFPPADRPEVKPIPEGWRQRIWAFLKYSPSLEFGEDILWVVISLWFWFWALFVAVTMMNAVGIPISLASDRYSGIEETLWTLKIEEPDHDRWQIVAEELNPDHWEVEIESPDDTPWKINIYRGRPDHQEAETSAGADFTGVSMWLAIPILLAALLLTGAAMFALVFNLIYFDIFWRRKSHAVKESQNRWLFNTLNLLFLVALIFSVGYVYRNSLHPVLQDSQVKDTSNLFEKYGRLVLLFIVYVALVVSSLMVCYRLLFALIGWGIAALILRPIYFILSAHQPFSPSQIWALVAEPMSAGEDSRTWRLEELEDAEIQLIREWAEVNRKTTEKRLLPTTVIFGALGLFGDTDAFNNAVQVAVSWMQSLVSTNDPFRNALSGVVIGWVWAFVLILLKLLANISVQSLIVEACMVAEYGHNQESSSQLEETANEEEARGCLCFWQR